MLGQTSKEQRICLSVSYSDHYILSSSNWSRLWETAFFEIKTWRLARFIEMSGVSHSVVWESRSPAQRVSSETLYKPSWPTETPYETSEGAIAGRASARAPPQHTDPNEGSVRRRNQGATSKDLGSHYSGRKNVWGGLKYSSITSRTEDSERIISELRWEIRDLKQEARSRAPAKERPRNKVNASKRKNPEYSTLPLNSHNEDFFETSSS